VVQRALAWAEDKSVTKRRMIEKISKVIRLGCGVFVISGRLAHHAIHSIARVDEHVSLLNKGDANTFVFGLFVLDWRHYNIFFGAY
jgi:hypothetical protein